MQKKDYEMLMDVIEYIRNHPEKEQELLEEIKKIWQKIKNNDTVSEETLAQTLETKDNYQEKAIPEPTLMEELLMKAKYSYHEQTIPGATYLPVDCLVFTYSKHTVIPSQAISKGEFESCKSKEKWRSLGESNYEQNKMATINPDGSCEIIMTPNQLVQFADQTHLFKDKTYLFEDDTKRYSSLAIYLTYDELQSLGEISEDIRYRMENDEDLVTHMLKHQGIVDRISKIMLPFIENKKDTRQEEAFWDLLLDYYQENIVMTNGRYNPWHTYINLLSNNQDLSLKEIIEQAKVLATVTRKKGLKREIVLTGKLNEQKTLYQDFYDKKQSNINISKIDKMPSVEEYRILSLDLAKGLCSERNYNAVKGMIEKQEHALTPAITEIRKRQERLQTQDITRIPKQEIVNMIASCNTEGRRNIQSEEGVTSTLMKYKVRLNELYTTYHTTPLYQQEIQDQYLGQYKKLNRYHYYQLQEEWKKRKDSNEKPHFVKVKELKPPKNQ